MRMCVMSWWLPDEDDPEEETEEEGVQVEADNRVAAEVEKLAPGQPGDGDGDRNCGDDCDVVI